MKKTTSFICCFLASFYLQANEDKVWLDYQQLAKKTALQTENLPLSKLASNASILVENAKLMLGQFISKNQQCENYLSQALAASGQMPNLSLHQIEQDYHADGKLPAVADASCYHAKDLLVHPATVVILSNTQTDNQQTRAQIKHELLEVLEHFSQVKSKV